MAILENKSNFTKEREPRYLLQPNHTELIRAMFIFTPRAGVLTLSDTIRRVFMRPVVSQSQHAVARGRKIAPMYAQNTFHRVCAH